MAPPAKHGGREKQQSPIEELREDSIPSPRAVHALLAQRPHVAPGTGPTQPALERRNAAPTALTNQALTEQHTAIETRSYLQMFQHHWNIAERAAIARDTEATRPTVTRRGGNAESIHQGNTNTGHLGRQNNTLTPHHQRGRPSQQSQLNPQAPAFRPAPHPILGHNAVRQQTAERQIIRPAQDPHQGQNSQHHKLPPAQNSVDPRDALQATRPHVPTPVPSDFRPTRMATFGPGFQRTPSAQEQRFMQLSGMSSNYRGDPGNWFNYSADIPDEENTSFWITQLPPNVHESEIFAEIRDCGRVYQLHVNREQVQAGRYRYAAAKLTFFTKAEVTRFASQYMAGQTLVVNHKRAHITRNRTKVREQSGLPAHYTRCLLVEGPRHLLEPTFVLPYLASLVNYKLDNVFFNSTGNHKTAPSELLIRFASFRGQASLAWKVFSQNAIFRNAGVRVQYFRDPCGV